MFKKFLKIILIFSFIFSGVYSQDNNYILTTQDNILINKVFIKVEDLIQENGEEVREKLLLQLSNILNKGNYSNRVTAILSELKNQLEEIELEDKQDEIIEEDSEDGEVDYLENIDFGEVKNTWLSRYNEVRSELGLEDYTYNMKLEKTAFDWSETLKEKNEATHKRNEEDDYYDYESITSRFAERGVVCQNINGITHTENIGRGTYYCSDGECSDELLEGISRTFQYYMSEKEESYRPHYNSIVNSYFTKIGMGVYINELSSGSYEFYLTVHYCTEFE